MRKQGTKGSMIIKIDPKKANDHLRSAFVRETLSKARLPQGMVEVFLNWIALASFSILWHGDRTQALLHLEGWGKETHFPRTSLCYA